MRVRGAMIDLLRSQSHPGLQQVVHVQRPAAAAFVEPCQSVNHRQEFLDPFVYLARIGALRIEIGVVVFHAARASISWPSCAGWAGASSPITAITSIGCAAGSSL